MFSSDHYGGMDLVFKVKAGEPWKMVYGPVFFYLNSAPSDTNYTLLWENAKSQVIHPVNVRSFLALHIFLTSANFEFNNILTNIVHNNSYNSHSVFNRIIKLPNVT